VRFARCVPGVFLRFHPIEAPARANAVERCCKVLLTDCHSLAIIARMNTKQSEEQAQAAETLPLPPLELRIEATDISSGLAILRIPPFSFLVTHVTLERSAPRGCLFGVLFGPLCGSQRQGSRMIESELQRVPLCGESSDWPAVLWVEFLTLPMVAPVSWSARDLLRCSMRVTLNPLARVIPERQTWEMGEVEVCQQTSQESGCTASTT
jgi:hypothetical protein